MSSRKKILILVGAILALATIVVISIQARRQDATLVQTSEVERVSELIAKVNASGEIKPKEFVELQAEISGVITDLYVKEGDFVNKGDVLLRIDPTQTETETRAQQALLEAALSEASNQQSQITLQETNLRREEASVAVAEAEINKAQQALELANSNFRRKQELFEQNLLPRESYDASKNERVAAESNLAAAQARLRQAEASFAVAQVTLEQARNAYQGALSRVDQNRAILERAQDSLSKTVIRSPLTGVITQMNVERGERAVPGTLNNPSATIMIIADLSVIEAEIEVDETDIVDVKLGQKAEVLVDALPNQPLQGFVTEIGNSAIPRGGQTQEARDFKVVIRLDAPPDSLRPGLSCTADITTATRENVLTVPIQALAMREFRIDEEGNPIFGAAEDEADRTEDRASKQEFQGVFVVKDRKAQFVPIKTGITGDTEIEVETGLEEGSVIITGSYKALRGLSNGDAVKVEENKEVKSV